MVLIRTPSSQRIVVNWNVQAFVNACAEVTGATNFGTYLGHSPSAERATDAFTTIPMPRTRPVLGDAIAEFTLRSDVWKRYAVRYIIWRQRINWNDGEGWIAMANRGDDTQNHFDHDHISFNVIPRPATTDPTPTTPGGIDMLIVNVKDTGIFFVNGDDVRHFGHPDHVLEWVRAGVPYQDKAVMSAAVFRQYTGWGQAQGIRGIMGDTGIDAGIQADIDAGDTFDEDEPVPYDEMIDAVRAGMDEVYNEYVQSMQV